MGGFCGLFTREKRNRCWPCIKRSSSVGWTTAVHFGIPKILPSCVTRSKVCSEPIQGMDGLDYWSRLNILRLYSVQRRRERYIILYVFKIIHGLVPNCGLNFSTNPRTGIHAIVPKLDQNKPCLALQMQENSFAYVGPKLYNSIPSSLRRRYHNIDPVLTFKTDLDCILTNVPDEPTIPGKIRRANTNSLIDQFCYYCSSE